MSKARPAKDQIVGALLAGGRSSRMFPSLPTPADKGLLELAGRPMLEAVADRMKPQVHALLLNANGDPARFGRLGLPVMADTVAGYVGPLAGLLACMRWALANAPGATHIATAPADTPFLPLDLVARLALALDQHGIAIATSGSRVHPVVGLWPVNLAGELDQVLASGDRKMLAWIERHDTATVAFEDAVIGAVTIDPFFNVNTPEDLAYARQLFAAASLEG